MEATMHMNENNKTLIHARPIDPEFWSFDIISVGKGRFTLFVTKEAVADFMDQMNTALNRMMIVTQEDEADDSLIPEQEAQYRQDTM